MVKSRRVFTREFKLAAIKELESGKPLGYVARRLEVNANPLVLSGYPGTMRSGY